MNGTTKNGCIVYPSAGTTTQVGQRGAARPSKPQAGQVAAMGAKDPGTGRKHEPVTDGVKAHGNDGEARQMLAAKLYPSSKGSRFA